MSWCHHCAWVQFKKRHLHGYKHWVSFTDKKTIHIIFKLQIKFRNLFNGNRHIVFSFIDIFKCYENATTVLLLRCASVSVVASATRTKQWWENSFMCTAPYFRSYWWLHCFRLIAMRRHSDAPHIFKQYTLTQFFLTSGQEAYLM